MRLTASEHRVIVEEIRKVLPTAQIYLYGSRTQDALKGGDIDLLAVAPDSTLADKIDILLAIKARIGEQRIDLKIVDPGKDEQDAFLNSILPTAVPL